MGTCWWIFTQENWPPKSYDNQATYLWVREETRQPKGNTLKVYPMVTIAPLYPKGHAVRPLFEDQHQSDWMFLCMQTHLKAPDIWYILAKKHNQLILCNKSQIIQSYIMVLMTMMIGFTVDEAWKIGQNGDMKKMLRTHYKSRFVTFSKFLIRLKKPREIQHRTKQMWNKGWYFLEASFLFSILSIKW